MSHLHSRGVYLDYAATTPMDPLVAQAMCHYMTIEGCFGNPASIHSYGVEAEEAVAKARQQVAALINAQSKEIIWTSGATEANNLTIRGIAQAYFQNGFHFVTVKTEHKSVLDTFAVLEQMGAQVTYLDVDKKGLINLNDLKNALRQDTVLVSVMHVNNETGVIQDIAAISEVVHQSNALLHVDAVQSAGKVAIDVEAMQIDLLSLSAHKIYGPKGIGALYIRQKPRVRVVPLITGGAQERGLRAGTLATHQIVGMGEAFALAKLNLEKDQQRLIDLRELLFAKIAVLGGVIRNSPENGAPHILNVSIEGVEGDALVYGMQGVAFSSGSACNSQSVQPSHVLTALGVSQDMAHRTLRLSIGRFTTEQDILTAAQHICRHVSHLRHLSPYRQSDVEVKPAITVETEQASSKIKYYLQQNQRVGVLDETRPEVIALHSQHPASLTRCSLYFAHEQGQVSEVKYQVYGCDVTIACLAWLAELMENKNITEVKNITIESMVQALEIPPAKRHCAAMVCEMIRRVE